MSIQDPPKTDTPTHVSEQDYLDHYAERHYEWVRGELIKISPATRRHEQIVFYLNTLLKSYFEIRGGGEAIGAPFILRLASVGAYREPDIMVVLEGNPGTLNETVMQGPPDICIEVVSDESTSCAYGTKFAEYEKGGVREYWLIDPARQLARFHRLAEGGIYRAVPPAGTYTTPLLHGLVVDVPTLWQEKLPGPGAVVRAIADMLNA